MRVRLAATILVAIVAAAHPRLQTPATPETSAQPDRATTPPPVAEIIRRAVARAEAQDEGEAELRFESLVATTVESLNLPRTTRIDRALNQSSGELYVSQNDYGVVEIDFRLLRPVRYVWGLVASLTRATGQLEFEQVEPNIWLPSMFDVRIDLRVFFVTQRRHIERRWVERRRVAGDGG